MFNITTFLADNLTNCTNYEHFFCYILTRNFWQITLFHTRRTHFLIMNVLYGWIWRLCYFNTILYKHV